MYDQLARQDFSRARRRAFWQKLRNWFTGKDNDLLPLDEVRQNIPIEGPHYRGLKTIPIEKIVGSAGRYHEFNRAFLPMQDHTEDRWVNIGRAHYQDVTLPPIEVYKMGEVYFVKDGNHRVSVAHDRGQAFMDAFVTEIDIPVSLTTETRRADLQLKRETALFLDQTGLHRLHPEAGIELTLPGEYERLLEHIQTHQYYLSKNAAREVPMETAVQSWYATVYQPLLSEIQRQNLPAQFPNLSGTDLYLLVSEYQWLLREAYADEGDRQRAIEKFTEALNAISPDAEQSGLELTRKLKHAIWIDDIILAQERANFVQSTGLDIPITLPGKYEKILKHINDHRWYLGIEQERPIPWLEAVASWRDNLFTPLTEIIREQEVITYFPGRTEADLYIWLIDHKSQLSEQLGWEIAPEIAIMDLIGKNENPQVPEASRTLSGRRGPIFSDILVAIGHEPGSWIALDQAILIAQRNHSRIHGLHVIPASDFAADQEHAHLTREFERRCTAADISGKLAIENGSISRKIAERARWADLIALKLDHPPASTGLQKLSSGIREVLRRCGRPVLAIPGKPASLQRMLLAYDASPKADEALYLAAGLLTQWEGMSLAVLTIDEKNAPAAESQTLAREFLASHQLAAEYLVAEPPTGPAILEIAKSRKSDLILIGGYGAAPIREIVFGSTVDYVLQKSKIPVLIST